MALLRYPGSKERIADAIVGTFPSAMQFGLWSASLGWEYREPFFGGGGVGFRLLDILNRQCAVRINDADRGIAALWAAVRDEPAALCAMVNAFEPTVESFDKLKAADGEAVADDVEAGFAKLALHRISFSGLGAMAGGPLGGYGQATEYKVGCRWNAKGICKEIRRLSETMNGFPCFRVTTGDFEVAMQGAAERCFVYLDPPYYEKGPELYRLSMEDDDHARLAHLLRNARFQWALSYDNHPYILSLYKWARVRDVHITYTTAVSQSPKRRAAKEILITPD